jgi:hypothetical protein
MHDCKKKKTRILFNFFLFLQLLKFSTSPCLQGTYHVFRSSSSLSRRHCQWGQDVLVENELVNVVHIKNVGRLLLCKEGRFSESRRACWSESSSCLQRSLTQDPRYEVLTLCTDSPVRSSVALAAAWLCCFSFKSWPLPQCSCLVLAACLGLTGLCGSCCAASFFFPVLLLLLRVSLDTML